MTKKKSKLSEKAARMPEIRQDKWDRLVAAYVESIQAPGSESAKSHRFAIFLHDLLGIEEPGFIEEYVEGIERYVRKTEKDRILRGHVDNLFGNLVIEFERDMRATRSEAEDQVRKYVSFVWSDEAPARRRPYVGIATDGLRFAIYSPTLADESKAELEPEDVGLQLIEELSLSDLEPAEVYFWLDRYFRRQETLPPTTENIVADFGVKSHAFQVASGGLLSLWKRIQQEPQFAVVYESWAKYLLIVYGSSVADEELFIRHTYLATLAKLMAWCRLAEATTADVDELVLVLEGEFFKRQGIENFLEEDFFSWLVRDEARAVGVEMARMLFSLLQNYNLRELSEDVLKSLYQGLVDPETRHDLGEYYTPDWLAHRMVRKLLDEKPDAKMLDPACGSGTFLYLAIREKRERLGDSLETLQHIQDAVVGIDIHPLAVIVAKTNYVLGLGDLLQKRTGAAGKVTVPVYLGDSMRLPEWTEKPTLWMQLPSYRVDLDGAQIYIPEKLLSEPGLYDEAIEMAREFAAEGVGRTTSVEEFVNYVRTRRLTLADDEALTTAVFRVSQTLKEFVESDRDTIWAFVLKNIYKPLFLRRAFDCAIGNPPWLAYRYADAEYQPFLKDHMVLRYGLLSRSAENISNMELASLFFVRTADMYLKDGGTVGFVLPRSLFSADQHHRFRTGKVRGVGLALTEIWDLERVSPLFNVPCCVVFAARTNRAEFDYPIAGEVIAGRLGKLNEGLERAQARLTVQEVAFHLNRVSSRTFWGADQRVDAKRRSSYAAEFQKGADIYPRAFWFAEIRSSSLGFDPEGPPLGTARQGRTQWKPPYKNVELRGNVERRFLFSTLLSSDLLPFGHLDYRLVVLPLEVSGQTYRLIGADEARERGFWGVAKWVEQAEREWEVHKTQKRGSLTLLGSLDYRGKLTSQPIQPRHRVLYPSSATHMCACLLRDERTVLCVGKQEVQTQAFIAEHVTYYIDCTHRVEAFYLTAALNAPVVNQLLKPMQARGQWGARHIHKKVLELPIPEFDKRNPTHLGLAQLGEQCAEKVQEWLDSGGPGKVKAIGRLRTMVREMLAEELREIDLLVEPMLRGD